jgi:hypothetical protein
MCTLMAEKEIRVTFHHAGPVDDDHLQLFCRLSSVGVCAILSAVGSNSSERVVLGFVVSYLHLFCFDPEG